MGIGRRSNYPHRGSCRRPVLWFGKGTASESRLGCKDAENWLNNLVGLL